MSIANDNTETQENINKISAWTAENKMLLNRKKSNLMIFNFTTDYQFSSRIEMEGEIMGFARETKLLGVLVNDRLNWDNNTVSLVRRANARMRLLHKLVQFNVPREDLLNIYVLYVRSILEQSCQVWHSSLTLENFQDLERVQKNALRIILQEDYMSYSHALNMTGLSTLFVRRELLCLRFAKSCLKNKHMKSIFPLNDATSLINTRFREVFKVTKSRTERLKNSAVQYMQRLLNSAVSKKTKK